ncbi:hypothetical protein GCM10010228_80720 [Streptomyces massasporeus]|nr:hypothetical protein GCM10010228_80720 [Streptomyces massasporeus]
MTVLVSSDTDIYISPGLYGDCLPTVATGGAADSFRAGRRSRLLFMLAHAPGTGKRLFPGLPGNERGPTGIHVTQTLWPSSK